MPHVEVVPRTLAAVLLLSSCASYGGAFGYQDRPARSAPTPTPAREASDDAARSIHEASPPSPLHGYDRHGAPAGRKDEHGNFYDASGAPAGRVDDDQRYYDRTGRPTGRADESGRFYDGTGAPLGRLDAGGQIYDRTGAPAGRVDASGHVYDKSGAPAGRVDGTCDAACKRDVAKHVLDAAAR